jgi:presenilin-like A22 family membrane protease
MVIILKQLSLSVHSRCLLAFLVLVVELQNQWYIFYEGDIVKVYTIIYFFVILFSIVTLFVLTTELITKRIF